MSRYAGFYKKLLSSPSRDIGALARIESDDPMSTTCRNVRLLRNKTGLSQPYMFKSMKVNTLFCQSRLCQKRRSGDLAS